MKHSSDKLAFAVALAAATTAASAQQLEEIIVTAQKRTQSVQDIPLAVSAYDSDELKAMDAKGFGAIVLRTPSLSGSGKWGVSVIGDNIGDEEYTVSMIDFLVPMSLPGYGRSVRFEARYNFF